MSKVLKALLIAYLLLPCSGFAQDVAEDVIPRVTADIDTVVELSRAPYLWDEAVPMDADSVTDYDEASSLLIRKVPATVKDKFAKDKDLKYHQKPPKQEKKWKWQWMITLVNFLASLSPRFWLRLIIYALIAVAIVIILYLRKNANMFRFIRKKATPDVKELLEDDTDYDLTGYESQIQQAVTEGKLRVAIRLMYLQTLWLLADKGMIAYSKEKTNAAYLRSLSKTQWHKPFARLTVDYEYIWYGEVPVNNEQFNVIKGQFSQFMNDLGYTR